jgi:hypothetical protein
MIADILQSRCKERGSFIYERLSWAKSRAKKMYMMFQRSVLDYCPALCLTVNG